MHDKQTHIFLDQIIFPYKAICVQLFDKANSFRRKELCLPLFKKTKRKKYWENQQMEMEDHDQISSNVSKTSSFFCLFW